MPPDQANQPTGYGSDQDSWTARAGSTSLAADAMAAVIEKHRAEIASAPATPEARQFALDRLDAVYLDMLRTVLDESSAVELLFDKHGGGS